MESTALITDLYELTMAQSYLEHGKTGNAVFSLFVRRLPENRNFLVACGLETLIKSLENFKFGDRELRYLKSLGIFKDWFLDYSEGAGAGPGILCLGGGDYLLPERAHPSGGGSSAKGSAHRNLSYKPNTL
jgi:hypothetical protein